MLLLHHLVLSGLHIQVFYISVFLRVEIKTCQQVLNSIQKMANKFAVFGMRVAYVLVAFF